MLYNEELIKYWQLLIIIFINSSLVWRIVSLFLALNWAYISPKEYNLCVIRMCSKLINNFLGQDNAFFNKKKPNLEVLIILLIFTEFTQSVNVGVLEYAVT